MKKATQLAIDAKIAEVMSGLRAEADKMADTGSFEPLRGQGPRLRGVFLQIESVLVKKAEEEIAAFYLEMGVRDPEVIADGIEKAVVLRVASLGRSLAAAHWNGNRQYGEELVLEFETSMKAYGARILPRARIAVESQRRKDPTYSDRIVKAFKDHPLTAWVVVVVMILGGVTVSPTLRDLLSFLWGRLHQR